MLDSDHSRELELESWRLTSGCIGKYGSGYIDEWLLHLTSLVVSFAVITLLFAMMFKWLPDTPVDWYDVWLGAILTTIFFEIGKLGVAFYIGKQGLESTYGAAASIIVVLIWVYYSSQIILMGQKSPMRSLSIKARSRSETNLTVLLIKTDRFRPDMTLTPRI